MISLDTAVRKKIAVIDQPILLAPRIAHLLRRCPLHTYLLCICDVGEGGAVNQSWEHAEGQEEVEGGWIQVWRWRLEEMVCLEVPVWGWNQQRGQRWKFGNCLRGDRQRSSLHTCLVSEACLDPKIAISSGLPYHVPPYPSSLRYSLHCLYPRYLSICFYLSSLHLPNNINLICAGSSLFTVLSPVATLVRHTQEVPKRHLLNE